MAITYTLVQRKDMSKGALEGAKLFYAQAVMSRRVVFDDLCDEIAENLYTDFGRHQGSAGSCDLGDGDTSA